MLRLLKNVKKYTVKYFVFIYSLRETINVLI